MLPQKLPQAGKRPPVLLGEGPVAVALGKEGRQGNPRGPEGQAAVIDLIHKVYEAQGIVLVLYGLQAL